MARSTVPHSEAKGEPPSPSDSIRSSESEGRPVREKLQETRIDAVAASDAASGAAPNGTATVGGAQSSSASENGRPSRKRSHESLGDSEDKIDSKKERTENPERHHARKRSRDVASPLPTSSAVTESPATSAASRVDEHDGDAVMVSSGPPSRPAGSAAQASFTPTASVAEKESTRRTSPHNKRTYDQAKDDEGQGVKETAGSSGDGKPSVSTKDEPVPKRPREKSDIGGFQNTSAASPFANLAQAKPSSSADKAPEKMPQTSEEKFKQSGFGSMANAGSPFAAVTGSKSPSPFGATTGGAKLTSFASSTPSASSTPAASGFGALGGGASTSAFGGGFGGGIGQTGFGGLAASKGGLSSFAKPGAGTITGLSTKPARPFGAAPEPKEEGSDDEDGDDNDAEHGSDKEESEKIKQTEQTRRGNLAPQPVETGEEGEETVWSGRAKLYKMAAGDQGWKESGVGPFKFNITSEAPKKARFILRADGTHRLLLNAAVTKSFILGGPKGERVTDGKLLLSVPSADGGNLEPHLLRMNAQRGTELYDLVQKVKEQDL